MRRETHAGWAYLGTKHRRLIVTLPFSRTSADSPDRLVIAADHTLTQNSYRIYSVLLTITNFLPRLYTEIVIFATPDYGELHMAFPYDPTKAYPCLPPGRYKATLLSTVEGLSRKGHPLLTLNFELVHRGQRRRISGWISNPVSLYFLKELADALDQSDSFAKGAFDAENFGGCEILVGLRVIQTGLFGDQNIISHYYRANPGQPIKRTEVIDTASSSLYSGYYQNEYRQGPIHERRRDSKLETPRDSTPPIDDDDTPPFADDHIPF